MIDTKRAFSLFIRATAVAGAFVALVSQNPSARAAAPAVLQAAPVIPVPNLTAYWNLDETTGTTANDSSGSNHGQHWNNPTISAAGDVSPVPTPNLRSLIFAASGGTQRVAVNDSASLRLTGPLTISAWVNPSAYTPSYQKGVLEK